MRKMVFLVLFSVIGSFCFAQSEQKKAKVKVWERIVGVLLQDGGAAQSQQAVQVVRALPLLLADNDKADKRGTGRQSQPGAQHDRPRSTSTGSDMLVDDLARHSQRVSNLTPITIGKPMPFEELRGSYQNFSGFVFGGFNLLGLNGFVFAESSNHEPVRQLPAYLQQELFEEYQGVGQFNPLIPGTGHMGQHLGVMAEELRIGKGILADKDGKPAQVRIGPQDWTTTRYVVVSSVGIVDEEVTGRQLGGNEIVQMLNAFGLNRSGRAQQILQETLGQFRKTTVDRKIVGILYVAVVDVATRSVMKSCTGIGAVDYRQLESTKLPVYTKTQFRYPGAYRFGQELVKSCLYDAQDREADIRKFLERR